MMHLRTSHLCRLVLTAGTGFVLLACISLVATHDESMLGRSFRYGSSRSRMLIDSSGRQLSRIKGYAVDMAVVAMQHVPLPFHQPLALSDGRLRVGVADATSFHEEVFGAVVYSLMTEAGESSAIKPFFFRNQMRYNYYDDVLLPLGVNATFHKTGRLDRWLRDLDVLVLTSADFDLFRLTTELRSRRRLHVVLLVHHAEDWTIFEPGKSGTRVNAKCVQLVHELGAQGRLTLLTLAHHVSEYLAESIASEAIQTNWKAISEIFVPILPVPRVRRPDNYVTSVPTRLVIQGQISNTRRDYPRTFSRLLELVTKKPPAWGLQPAEPGSTYPLLQSSSSKGSTSAPPIQLHLMGHSQLAHMPSVPPALGNIVRVHPNLDFGKFYNTLSTMDALLPAFKPGHGEESSSYLTIRASSSIPAAIMARVPIVMPDSYRASYDYVAGPALIAQPAGEDALQAIENLRHADGQNAAVHSSEEEWKAYEDSLNRMNSQMWQRVFNRVQQR